MFQVYRNFSSSEKFLRQQKSRLLQPDRAAEGYRMFSFLSLYKVPQKSNCSFFLFMTCLMKYQQEMSKTVQKTVNWLIEIF